MTDIENNEGIRVREVKECLLCGAQGTLIESGLRDVLSNASGYWGIMECTQCRLAWLYPQPLPDEIAKFYNTYYTHALPEIPFNLNSVGPISFRQMVKNGVLYEAFGYHDVSTRGLGFQVGSALSRLDLVRDVIGGVIRWLPGKTRGRVLDVGCGNGKFLLQMKSLGWEVVGIDPDETAVEKIKTQMGFEVYKGVVEDITFELNSFDAITLHHVIEHLPNPIRTLSKCRDLLKENGRLIVVTPNIKSWGRKIFGASWRGLEIPRHLHIFSQQTLRDCATKAHLRIQEVRTRAKLAEYIWCASRAIKKGISTPGGSLSVLPTRIRLESKVFWIVEHLLLRWRPGWGEEIVLISTK